jgi:hypothetical protein
MATATRPQRHLLGKGRLTKVIVGVMDHFSKSKGTSYSTPTIIAAQPTVVYAPMPQLQPVIIASQPQKPEVKSKSAAFTFEGKHGKSATITFTKTIPARLKEEWSKEEWNKGGPQVSGMCGFSLAAKSTDTSMTEYLCNFCCSAIYSCTFIIANLSRPAKRCAVNSKHLIQ